MMRALIAALALVASPLHAQSFDVTAIGVRGGVDDGNLTAWMIAPHGDSKAVMCDAGSLVNGIEAARAKGSLKGSRETILHDDIRGYMISHAHLDHLAGMLIAAPDDSKKPIYVLPSVGQKILDSYFNWDAWANFTDRGKAPALGTYKLTDLTPGATRPIDGTAMTLTAYPLAHGGVESTAFLVESGKASLLCLGDTGPDSLEKQPRLAQLWQAVAPRVREHSLKAIIIEVSYASDRPDKLLFGHLTPAYLLRSLHELETAAGGKGSLKGLPIIVSHIKPALSGPDPRVTIMRELNAGNDLGVRFILPDQGQRWAF